MRAMPTTALPPRSTSPFPPSLIGASLQARRPDARVIQFGVIASKGNVSNLAVERGTVRRRFKAALQTVVQRSHGLPRGSSGKDYLSPGQSLPAQSALNDVSYTSDWSYIVMLSKGVYGASMEDLCGSVAKGLKWIKKLQDKGIGSGHQHTARDSWSSGSKAVDTTRSRVQKT